MITRRADPGKHRLQPEQGTLTSRPPDATLQKEEIYNCMNLLFPVPGVSRHSSHFSREGCI